jgi:hypothetical protein
MPVKVTDANLAFMISKSLAFGVFQIIIPVPMNAIIMGDRSTVPSHTVSAVGIAIPFGFSSALLFCPEGGREAKFLSSRAAKPHHKRTVFESDSRESAFAEIF